MEGFFILALNSFHGLASKLLLKKKTKTKQNTKNQPKKPWLSNTYSGCFIWHSLIMANS